MKKYAIAVLILIISIQKGLSQDQHVPTALENKMSDTLCDCINKLDFSKITNKKKAIAEYTGCIGKHVDILSQIAAERKEDITDVDAMEKLGVVIAKNLMAKNCSTFIKLSLLTTKNDEAGDNTTGATEGHIKRIDLKGFNYIVITDKNNSEKSFIWLRQFPRSEKFMDDITAITGKKINIKWAEIEVYLPQAKGYYKVKEITGVDFL